MGAYLWSSEVRGWDQGLDKFNLNLVPLAGPETGTETKKGYPLILPRAEKIPAKWQEQIRTAAPYR